MHTFICDENWKRTEYFSSVVVVVVVVVRGPPGWSCSDEKRRKLFPFPGVIFSSFDDGVEVYFFKARLFGWRCGRGGLTSSRRKTLSRSQGVDIRLLRLRFGGRWLLAHDMARGSARVVWMDASARNDGGLCVDPPALASTYSSWSRSSPTASTQTHARPQIHGLPSQSGRSDLKRTSEREWASRAFSDLGKCRMGMNGIVNVILRLMGMLSQCWVERRGALWLLLEVWFYVTQVSEELMIVAEAWSIVDSIIMCSRLCAIGKLKWNFSKESDEN